MLQEKLQSFIKRSEDIHNLLASSDILNDIKKMTELSKEQSSIAKIVAAAKEYNQIISDIEENKMLLDDKELADLAKEELKELVQVITIEEEIPAKVKINQKRTANNSDFTVDEILTITDEVA